MWFYQYCIGVIMVFLLILHIKPVLTDDIPQENRDGRNVTAASHFDFRKIPVNLFKYCLQAIDVDPKFKNPKLKKDPKNEETDHYPCINKTDKKR